MLLEAYKNSSLLSLDLKFNGYWACCRQKLFLFREESQNKAAAVMVWSVKPVIYYNYTFNEAEVIVNTLLFWMNS